MEDLVAKWQATAKSLFLTSMPTMECCHSPLPASYRCLRIVLCTYENFKGRTYTKYMETHPQSVNPAEECRGGVLTSLSIFPLLQRLVCLLVTPRSTLRSWKKREMVSRMLRRLAGVGQRSLRANE